MSWKKKLFAACMFMIVFIFMFSGCAGPLKNLKKGQKEIAKGNLDKAAELMAKNQNIKADNVDYPIYQLNLASALWFKNDPEGAKSAFDKASEVIWGTKGTWGSFQEVGLGLKNESKVKWVGQENERLFIRFYTGMCHLLKQEYDDAIVEFRRCNDINDRYPLVHYCLGLAYKEIEDENARVCFIKADSLAGAPSSGSTLLKLIGRQESIKSEDTEGNPFARLELACLESTDGNKEDAQKIYESVKESLVDNPNVTGDSFDKILQNGLNLCLFVQQGYNTRWDRDGAIRVKIDNKDFGKAFYIDTRSNRQSSKSALTQAGLSIAGQYGRNVISSRVPFASLFMGEERDGAIKTWLLLPAQYKIYETQLEPGEYNVTVEAIDKKGKVRRSTQKSIKVGTDLQVVPIYL